MQRPTAVLGSKDHPGRVVRLRQLPPQRMIAGSEGMQICRRINRNAAASLRLAVDLNNMHLLNEPSVVVIGRP